MPFDNITLPLRISLDFDIEVQDCLAALQHPDDPDQAPDLSREKKKKEPTLDTITLQRNDARGSCGRLLQPYLFSDFKSPLAEGLSFLVASTLAV